MTKIKDLPKFKRPREKLFEKGPDALKDYELLAILLRTGYQGKSALEVAKRILRTTKLKGLPALSPQELSKLKGVGKSRASTISAAIAFSRRIFNIDKNTTITTPEDVAKVTSFLRNKKREYLVVLCLNARNQLIKKHTISLGTLTDNLVHPREVFIPAIKNHAAEVIIVHNHPSGNLEYTSEDVEVTRRLVEAGDILGIEVQDHIIVSKNGYVSLKNKGIL